MNDPSDPTLVGYARVSTVDQDPELQHRALSDAGCHRVWTDYASGGGVRRPQWEDLWDHLRPGDTVVVWKLDRVGRSLSHLVRLIEDLSERGVGIRSLTEPVDTTSSTGRLLLHIVAAMAEFERDLIRERTEAGMEAARARGQRMGRPPKMTPDKLAAAKALLVEGATVEQAAGAIDVSRATLARALAADRAAGTCSDRQVGGGS